MKPMKKNGEKKKTNVYFINIPPKITPWYSFFSVK